eukprot:6839371-Prymnesium_polylepis.1
MAGNSVGSGTCGNRRSTLSCTVDSGRECGASRTTGTCLTRPSALRTTMRTQATMGERLSAGGSRGITLGSATLTGLGGRGTDVGGGDGATTTRALRRGSGSSSEEVPLPWRARMRWFQAEWERCQTYEGRRS